MSILVVVLTLILLALSWKYILRLEPAGVFAAMWIFFAMGGFLLQQQIAQRFYGTLYILLCVTAFTAGTIFCDTFVHPTPASDVRPALRTRRVMPLLLILLAGAMVNPVYSITLHGFSIRALLNMQDLLNMNNQISEDRYYTGEAYSIVNQFFLIFSYAAPAIGGFCYRQIGKVNKTLCVLTLLPGTFIALTQSMKMVMMTSFILWFAGYVICSYTFGLSLRIKPRVILRLLAIIAAFFAILFISMVFRTGEISERTVLDISQKFVTYSFGHLHCFDLWYTTYTPGELAFGSKTFMGISNLLGLEERVQGIYPEYVNIGINGFYGISNVYTIFRPLIEDIGEAGTALIMFLAGFGANYSVKHLKAHRQIFLHQVILVAIFSYLLWSFVASFYAYTSYLAMFFLLYFLFRFLQRVPCGE